MRLLLISVVQRLAGMGGDPVIQLQTAFGGGKTHTMLAVFHLATRKVSTDKLAGIPALLDEAQIDDLPVANIAVLDGIALSVSQGKKHKNITANTLWGEMAWQLAGKEGYRLVEVCDKAGTAPGKDVLIDLLTRAAPCVVLIDELQKFISDLAPGKPRNAGTYEANLKFIQALTEAFKVVPDAILLASLPESESETGNTFGQKALVTLEKHFGRVESVWKPVATREAFEIVRRRLFTEAGEPAEIKKISQSFGNYYREHSQYFPQETQSNDYCERICSAYPIHPEIFDRLYEDWSTLEKFQRTRGVLQYMAVIIYRLWQDNNRDALIMPGSIPLHDSAVRNKSIHYLPPGWEPILEREVDTEDSTPCKIEKREPKFGQYQAARRTMRTLFLGSAPSAGGNQPVKGIQKERIFLGTAQPGETVGMFEDVLKRLHDQLHYLYSGKGRFWLDTRPNLRCEMESRKRNINKLKLNAVLKQQVDAVFGRKHHFAGIHVFSESADIPDDFSRGLRLVVLSPEEGFNRNGGHNSAIEAAKKILQYRGEQPRQKRNRLLFFAADESSTDRLYDFVRTFMAWKDIVDDISLNLDKLQSAQAKNNQEKALKTLQQTVRNTYKWLLCPIQNKPDDQTIEWERISVNTHASNLIEEIENKLQEEEWIISSWSPVHLKAVLRQWYFKEGITEINALKVYHDTCQYLYLPKIMNDKVYHNAISQGLESEDFFGFAAAKENDRYLGFILGEGGNPVLDTICLLIECTAAAEYKARLKSVSPGTSSVESSYVLSSPEGNNNIPIGQDSAKGDVSLASARTVIKKRFYGMVELDPVKAKMDFDTIVDEIIQHFTTKPGVKISVKVDIEAGSNNGFDEALQRTINENCRMLKFGSNEFEEE